MNETQRRIKAYQEALPGIKERVLGVALLLVMSLVMMTSATFAWLTISRAPEVSGVSTTVAANGNLEIALASGNGQTAPGESQVGDSSAAEGQSVVAANLTWGNLVNLSDPSYGLDNLVLRPAQLNRVALLDSPLYGADFSEDGRVSQLSSDFAYTSWVPPSGADKGYFEPSSNLGVRAISSTKYQAVGGQTKYLEYLELLGVASSKNSGAGSIYTTMAENKAYMQSLATMMGLYMTDRMDNDGTYKNPTVKKEDIWNMICMYEQFLQAFDAEADAMAALIDVQYFLQNNGVKGTPYTKEQIYQAGTSAALKNQGFTISDLEGFIADRNTIANDLEDLKELYNSGLSEIRWNGKIQDSDGNWIDSGYIGMSTIVANLVNVGECTMGDGTKIKNIGATAALNYLDGTQEAIITNGILYDFELRTGAYIQVKELSITVSIKRSIINRTESVKANVHTSADKAGYTLYNNDINSTKAMNTGTLGDVKAIADDTYGLAVDLWVRTNAQASYLTLEGNVLTESEMVRATGTDPNGNIVELYTVTISGEDDEGNAVSTSYDVYKGKTTVMDENGTASEVEAWILADMHSVISEEDLNGQEPKEKWVEIVTVIGYEGDNRVWNGDEYSSKIVDDATTQGVGSCYVYYADTPEDRARSLQLLESFNVAFVDGNARLLATAVMDTEHYYAANGRVTVPLVLSSTDSITVGEDLAGEPIRAITALEKNTPTRITAIVYLDGTRLTNDEVLAAADIQGQLNIQFGSTQALDPIEDEKLQNAYLSVSAELDKTSFDYDTATDPMTTTVTLKVDGDQPTTVTAFFLRQINSSQGSREDTMTFTDPEGDGTWTATHTFTAPGNYVLRIVELDGQEYVLKQDPLPTVNVAGFAVRSLACNQAENNHISIMTAENSSSVDLILEFATDDVDKMPTSVQGRFLNDETGSAVNINFTYNAGGTNAGKWTGKATFLSSGNYTMDYVVLDGQYFDLQEEFRVTPITASVTLGMKVAIFTNSPTSFKYVPSEMTANMKLLDMQVKIMNNAGDEMPGLTGVKLVYGMRGSIVKTMDTDLVWNGTYYVGELTAYSDDETTASGGPGIWEFRTVTVGSNTVTNATTSPTFTIMSPEPPEYVDHATTAYQYAPNNDATMNVSITNSSAAKVAAYIVKDGASEGTWVLGTIGLEGTTDSGQSYNNWSFKVPTDANGYQDGNWQLTQLKIWDAFDADGNAYTEDAPLVFDESVVGTTNKTKVVCRVNVSFTAGQSKDFGKDASGNVTGTFMQSHTISGLNVDIKDFENEPVQGVSDVKLTFTYVNQSSKDYGGYTSTDLTQATEGATVYVDLNSVNDTTYTQSKDATILYAGDYTTTFSFKVSDREYKYAGDKDEGNIKALPTNAPKFTVWSKAPTVTISSISPAEGTTRRYYPLATPTNTNQIIEGDFNRILDEYNALVYIYYNYQSGLLDQEIYRPQRPQVTLKLEGMPASYSATMLFKNATDETYNTTFTFTNTNSSNTQYVGYCTEGTESWGSVSIPLYPTGKQTVGKISVIYNSMTFAVDLSHDVTINQPTHPYSVSYSSTATNGLTIPTTPSTTYAIPNADGVVKVTLPGSQTWTENKSTSADGTFAAVGTPTTRTVYTQVYNTWEWFTTYYDFTKYTETKTMYQAQSSTTTWVNTNTITGWKIGNTTYKPGETVTITGNVTITPVVTVTEGDKTTTNTTATYYAYTYVQTASATKKSSVPNGYGTKVDSATDYTTDITYS